MAWGDLSVCRKCGRTIVFVRSHKGHFVPCNDFSVKVVPDKRGRLYYLGEGKTIWGSECDRNDPSGITAWKPHYGSCTPVKKNKPGKKTKAQIAAEREKNEAACQRKVAELLAQREKEWAAGGF